jgi:hypothetical protein
VARLIGSWTGHYDVDTRFDGTLEGTQNNNENGNQNNEDITSSPQISKRSRAVNKKVMSEGGGEMIAH